ncbi:MAG: inorganic phosphate transporter [Desulfobacteraceae bacterium]|nr:MAG: inorganic phosphate transporter [Desulfobacteraceae bacterium]
MSSESIILVLGYAIGLYMAWNIGANDLANSMASAVGAKAITVKQAVLIAGVLNVVGATFIGSHVTDTIRHGIVSPGALTDPHETILGALSALLSAALWVSFATWRSLPVSTTHSIVGAMVGFGLITGGGKAVQWQVLGGVVASWVISPLFALIIGLAMFKIIVWLVMSRAEPHRRALRYAPMFIGLAVFIVVMSFLYKTPLGKAMQVATPVAIVLSILAAAAMGFAGKYALHRAVSRQAENGAEAVFRFIQVGTSCYVALAQGANDVANAIGPLAVIYFFVNFGEIGSKVPVPIFLLLFGGIGIAAGIAMAGRRVMETMGERITTLTNTRGFSVDFAAATTVLIASKLGLPVSTTHSAVGGIIGVGLAGGIDAVNLRVVFQIILYWVLTVPAAALTSMGVFSVLRLFF